MEIVELPKIGSYEFLAEPFHCDFKNRLFMGHLGNHMLNAADFHSHDRGFGMTYLNTIQRTWVLSRLAIEMEEMPPAYAKFKVDTWVESALRFFTNRSFKVYDPESQKTYFGKVTYHAKTDELVLRGSLDKAGVLGRSQTWKRKN